MRIVFSGAGPVTVMAARTLTKKQHEVIIIETDKEKIDELSEKMDCSFLHGDSGKPDILKEVNPQSCDFLFCLANNDQVNIITSLLGRSLGFKRIVTSIEDPELENMCQEIGLENVIIPARVISHGLVNMTRGLDHIDLASILKHDARFFTFIASKQEAVPAAELDIPEQSLIIMDNAPYHDILSEHSPPTPQSSKKKIKEWLEQNKVYCRDDCLKPELVELLIKMAPEPIYAVDEIATSFGHKVLRTPLYHPELQPIETCWSVVKNHVAKNCDFTVKNLIKQLDCGFDKVTAATYEKIIKKVRKIEDEFWATDIKMDAQ